MEIFYTASYLGKEKYQKYYDLVGRVLEGFEVEVVSTEKGNYLEILSKSEFSKFKDARTRHYEAVKKGIRYADAVVIEVSNEDFQLGHEATLAIQSRKHVLCLSLNEDFSEKIKNRFFHGAKYNEASVEGIVGDFIRKVEKESLEIRFNMFLSERQVSFLEGASAKAKVNKSEYLRMLIDKEMKI